jgi:hypothetical protein
VRTSSGTDGALLASSHGVVERPARAGDLDRGAGARPLEKSKLLSATTHTRLAGAAAT